MASAVIMVDVRNDLCGSGSAPANEGVAGGGFDHAVATRDYHLDRGAHFSGDPAYATKWLAQCVADSAGVAAETLESAPRQLNDAGVRLIGSVSLPSSS